MYKVRDYAAEADNFEFTLPDGKVYSIRSFAVVSVEDTQRMINWGEEQNITETCTFIAGGNKQLEKALRALPLPGLVDLIQAWRAHAGMENLGELEG